MLTLAYGYKVVGDEDDQMVRLVDEAVDQFSETMASNAFLVDMFPIRASDPSDPSWLLYSLALRMQCATCPSGSLALDGRRRCQNTGKHCRTCLTCHTTGSNSRQ